MHYQMSVQPEGTPIFDGLLARPTDRSTSHEAGARANVKESRQYVLNLLATFGACCDFHLVNLARRHKSGWSESRIRTARHELVKNGLVVDTGNTLPTPSGRNATVWSISMAGLDAMREAA